MAAKLVVAWVVVGGLVALCDAATLKVGVFDQRAAGGQGASVQGLVAGLRRHGYDAETFADLHLLALLQYDVVYLSDMHKPGRVHAGWRESLAGYVKAGGSVLQTWHHHIFPQVGFGVRRVYGSRRMHVQKGHPAVAGVTDFQAAFADHIVEKVARGATVLLRNDAGDAVAVAGRVGKGKVISTGLALAIPNGGVSAEPRGAELALLKALLAWLKPEIGREKRLAEAVENPMMHVSPPRALVAAGFDAEFRVHVGTREPSRLELEAEGARVEPLADAPTGRSWRVAVPTEPCRNVQRKVRFSVRAGEKTLEQTATVEAVWAPPPENEVRGVWLHVRDDRRPKAVMPELKRLGITMAVLRIAGGTAAFYASRVQPDVQDPLAPDGDWMAEAVAHAHANGIELHPYVNNCIVEGRTSPASLARLRDEGRLQADPEGKTIHWFCPSQEANIAAMERPMLELVTRYKVDGIQYDFIRYPNARGCFCRHCRALFEKETGQAVANWPEDVVRGPRHAEWVEFRCRCISAIVERISTKIRAAAPKVRISAAVFRNWPDCREANGQDWVHWCREGWLDVVCPMNYTLDAELFARRAGIHREAVAGRVPVLQGISIASSAGKMASPGELALQIVLARRSGAAGFIGFCYTPGHTSELFAPLQAWLDGRSSQ